MIVTDELVKTLRLVALHPDDADWMVAELDREQERGDGNRSVVVGRLEERIAGVERKLERVADLYIDEKLSEADHTSRHNELMGERHRLREQIDAVTANPVGRLEPVKNLVLEIKQAGFLAEHGSALEKRDLFKKTGSNPSLQNRELVWKPRGAWQLVRETLEKQGCLAHQHTAAPVYGAAVCAGKPSLASGFPLKCG